MNFSTRPTNSFDILRLILASFVLISHCCYIQKVSSPDIILFSNGQTYLGEIGLLGFFGLSGYLLTNSYCKTKNSYQFLVNRFLRIFPGFWVCLIITAFIIAPVIYIFEGGTINQYPIKGSWGAMNYIRSNIFLDIQQANIRNVLNSVWLKNLNGSLWTLIFEIECYVMTLILGLFGFFNRRIYFITLYIVIYLLFIYVSYNKTAFSIYHYEIEYSNSKLITSYFTGTIFYLFQARLNKIKYFSIILFIILLILLKTSFATLYLPLIIPFLFLSLFGLFKTNIKYDISYGLYIYSFPIQLLVYIFYPNSNIYLYILFSLILTSVFAFASYLLIEKPALNRKKDLYRILKKIHSILKNGHEIKSEV